MENLPVSNNPVAWKVIMANGEEDYWPSDPSSMMLDPQFYDVPSKVIPLYAAAPSTPQPAPEQVGTFACPVCGVGRPHGHSAAELVLWLRREVSRFQPEWEKIIVIDRVGDAILTDAQRAEKHRRDYEDDIDRRDAARTFEDMIARGEITPEEARRRMSATPQPAPETGMMIERPSVTYTQEEVRTLVNSISAAARQFGLEVVDHLNGKLGLRLAALATPQPDTVQVPRDWANLARQWFDNVQDLNPQYLIRDDYKVAAVLYSAVGMRVPDSIKTMLAPKESKE